MKIDDLITEAPMSFLSHTANKIKSFVPGGYGAKAQGTLDVGRVANKWYKDYMLYLGKLGADGFGSTRTFVGFLQNLGFTDEQLRQVINKGKKGPDKEVLSKRKKNRSQAQATAPAMDMSKLSSPVTEAQQIYEAMLTSKTINTLMLRAARVAAAARYGSRQALPDEPNPTAPRKPGAVDAAVDIGKAVVPGVAKAAGQVGAKLGRQAFNYGKQIVSPKAAKQRIEPTMGTPVPRNMPNPAAQPAPQAQKFQPARKAPQMKAKKVTKYKED